MLHVSDLKTYTKMMRYIGEYRKHDIARRVMDKYGNCPVMTPEKDNRVFFCDPSVGSYTLEDSTELKLHFKKDQHALHCYYAELSLYDVDVECSIYAVPPRLMVGMDNPWGFGIYPSPCWEQEASRGWPLHIRQSIANWLASRAPADYCDGSESPFL